MTGYDAMPHLVAAADRRVRQALLTAPQLMSVELAHGSGAILSTLA